MRGRFAAVVAGVAVSLATFAPAAVASGGVNSGGVNSGGGGGGGTSPTTAPAPTSCATITSFSNSTGYYSVWAAIWTSFSFTNSCGAAVTMNMSYLNGTTGVIDFARTSSTMTNGTIDEDWAAFSVPYTVTMTLTDSSGAVLATRSAVVTTKAEKTAGA